MIPIRRLLRSAALFLCVAGAAGPVCAADDLNTTLKDIAEHGHLTGLAWAAVTPEGVQIGATGLRNVEDKLPFDADSRFVIGSITKSIVATGVLKLVTEGKLDLDGAARDYIQGLDFDNPWRDSSPVTVRNLMDHTSGLNGSLLWQYSSRDVTPDTPLSEAFTRHSGALKIRFRPGTAFSYSNQGYALLGLIIERVTGERYEDYLEREILAPLGMTASSFHFRTQADGPYHDPQLAYSYGGGGRATAKPFLLRPAGQFSTTTADMAKYMQFLLGDGSVDGKQIVAPTLMAARGHPTTTDSVKAGLEEGYGLGLQSQTVAGADALCHGGAIDNVVALMCLFPKDGKAFFFDANSRPSFETYKKISDTLAHALALTPATIPVPHEMAADMTDWAGAYIPAPARYQTLYFPGFLMDNRTVSIQKDKVVLGAPGLPPRVIAPTGSHLFSAEDSTGNTHVFFINAGGDRMLSSEGSTFRKVPPLYIYGHWASIGLAVLGILWTVGAILVRAIRRFRSLPEHPLFTPFLCLAAALVTLAIAMAEPLEVQSDLSLLHILLAVATFALPLSLLYALYRIARARERGKLMTAHGVMAFFMLQLCAVLAYWGLMPLMSWTL